jgi:hypothetical protein
MVTGRTVFMFFSGRLAATAGSLQDMAKQACLHGKTDRLAKTRDERAQGEVEACGSVSPPKVYI